MKYCRRQAQLLQQSFFFGLLAVGLFLALPASTVAAPGELDVGFGNGGIATTTFPISSAATDVAVQADGKIVIVGGSNIGLPNGPMILARYDADGSLDSTFGNGGKTTATYRFVHDLSGIAIQADGRIVVAGTTTPHDRGYFLVARFETNGALDTSFGFNGFVEVAFNDFSVGATDDVASDIAIQPNGKIVIVGSSSDRFAVARLNADGSLDSSFDGDGRVTTTLGTPRSRAFGVALQPDGKIIAAGTNDVHFEGGDADFALVRYNPDGSLDTTFDGDGRAITPVRASRDVAYDVAVQSDGKIVAVGEPFGVVRYNTDGSLDASFDGDGIAITPLDEYFGSALSVAIQSNGKIVAAGSVERINSIDFFGALVRYNPNGSLDASFGNGGIRYIGTSTDTSIYGHAIQPDGKIVAAGYDSGRVIVARYIGDAASPGDIEDPAFFVRQHYLDFLSREPEAGEPWTAILRGCPDQFNQNPTAPSALCDRLTVSAAFFQSPEFRLKGFFVFNFYRLAFDRLPEYSEIIPDMAAVTGATPAEVFARKAAFTNSFVQRTEFTNAFGALSHDAYVAALLNRYGLASVTTPDPANPDGEVKVTLTASELSSRLASGTLTRAQALRAVADSDEAAAAEYNRAFVAMQYYGYLRRTPEQTGYEAWLRVINQDPSNVRLMVNGFVNSTEYRRRFGPN